MKPQFLFLPFAVLLTTCIGIRAISPTRGYNVCIKSGFSDEQRQSIVLAYTEWARATSGTVSFTKTNSPDYSQSVVIIKPVTQADLLKVYHKVLIGRNNYRGSDNFMYIAVDQSKAEFHQTALHEFGHVLGLDHDEEVSHHGKTVMTPSTNDASPALTCLDIQAFCTVWKCNASYLSPCQIKTNP